MIGAGGVVEAYGLLCRAVRLMLIGTFAALVHGIGPASRRPT